MHTNSFLRHLNALPFPLTIPYYVSYGLSRKKFKDGEMRSGESWMVLRDEHPHYRIPETREEWLEDLNKPDKDGQDEWLMDRVTSFAAMLKREAITSVFSVGSGGAIFEYYLKQHAPEIKVTGTELTEEGVERLKRVCTELDAVEKFDALNPADWQKLGNDQKTIVFIYRNEREFSDQQWRKIWDNLYDAKVQNVFMGLMWTLTARALVQLKIRNVKKRLRGETMTLTGYLRSFEGLRAFWKGNYVEREEIPFPTCTGLYLTRINR